MTIVLATLLVMSVSFNFYALLQVRRYRAGLRYLELEFDRFGTDAEARIESHESLIKKTREECKALSPAALSNAGVFNAHTSK